MSRYLERIIENLTQIEQSQEKAMDSAKKAIARVIVNDGLIHVFGCGHSHIPALDTFYRSGGLANVSPMLDTDLMLHNGAAKSSRMEKMQGIGTEIFRRYKVEQKDILIVFSASGKNEVPCEVAAAARNNGIFVIGVSSSHYFAKGGKLNKYVDLHIDCGVPYGDACIEVGSSKMGGLSTSAFCFILNSILIGGAELATQMGAAVPIYLSGNIEGGREHNITLENRYLGRIKHL